MQGTFSPKQHYFVNPDGGNVGKWASKVVSKFQDDPMVKEFSVIVLLRNVWVYIGRRENFGWERKENEFGRKEECRNIP